MTNQLESRLAEIRTHFVSVLQIRGVSLENAIEMIESGQNDKLALMEVQRDLHKITGTAATLGFKELGDNARNFEDSIELYLNDAGIEQGEILVGLKKLGQSMRLIRLGEIPC